MKTKEKFRLSVLRSSAYRRRYEACVVTCTDGSGYESVHDEFRAQLDIVDETMLEYFCAGINEKRNYELLKRLDIARIKKNCLAEAMKCGYEYDGLQRRLLFVMRSATEFLRRNHDGI